MCPGAYRFVKLAVVVAPKSPTKKATPKKDASKKVIVKKIGMKKVAKKASVVEQKPRDPVIVKTRSGRNSVKRV